MLVDDNADIITTFKVGLEENGFSVTAFQNPFEALRKFEASDERSYDLLLIDIRYEEYGIDGFQLYQKMRKIRKSDEKLPPVCFITAFSEYYITLKQSFPEISKHCFIKKPIQIIDLVGRLKQEILAFHYKRSLRCVIELV